MTHVFVYVGAFSMVLAAYLWYAPKLIKKPATAAPRAGSPDSQFVPPPAPVAAPQAQPPTQAPAPGVVVPGTVPQAVYGYSSPSMPLPMTPSGA